MAFENGKLSDYQITIADTLLKTGRDLYDHRPAVEEASLAWPALKAELAAQETAEQGSVQLMLNQIGGWAQGGEPITYAEFLALGDAINNDIPALISAKFAEILSARKVEPW